MRYRKKPIEVEAIKFDGTNCREVLEFIHPDMPKIRLAGVEKIKLPIVIETLEGDMDVSVGDYVIRGIQGELYPCKPDIFEQTYQPLKDASI